MLQDLRNWVDTRRIAIVGRLAGDDPGKHLRLYSAVIFVTGIAFGCVLMLLSRPTGLFVTILLGALIGYSIRAIISYRRRNAACARHIVDGR